MMVYVVLKGFNYEGNNIKAIFSTREKAELYMAKEDAFPYQQRVIEEWTVDEIEAGEG